MRILKGYEQTVYGKDNHANLDSIMSRIGLLACAAIPVWFVFRVAFVAAAPIISGMALFAAIAFKYMIYHAATKGLAYPVKLSVRLEWAPLSYAILLLMNFVILILSLFDLCRQLL